MLRPSSGVRMLAGSLAAIVVACTALAIPAQAAPPQAPSIQPYKVMTQNLYLGADVGIALNLLPDFAKAAQAMWDEVAATDFTARAPKLASAAVREDPDLIGLQEATTWQCKKDGASPTVDVFNFTEQYLAELEAAGSPYVVASAAGVDALNPGYAIPPIVGLTKVTDSETFQPLFGQDFAFCGFEIADALLVREDLASSVTEVGTGDYAAKVTVGGVLAITRGYAWADVNVGGINTRFATTHLESLWTAGEATPGAQQANELVAALEVTDKPLVVMGDFNNDPRDPRPVGAPNPGGQPEASAACPAQVADPTVETANSQCNAYWVMRKAGFTDVGPDAFDPANYTWGSMSELAGPDAKRIESALTQGNDYGFTDRLDFVFVKNGVSLNPGTAPSLVGNVWPDGPDVWECENTELQLSNTEDMSAILAEEGIIDAPVTGQGICFPTDHVGLSAELVAATASIGLMKSADVESVDGAGDVITYTFVATNTGSLPLTDVTITDELPELSELSCDQPAPAALAPAATLTCTATYTVTQADIDAGMVANTATLTGTDPDGYPVEDSAQEEVPATHAPSISVAKTASVQTASAVGEVIKYTMVATNTGNVTLTDVKIDDPLPGLADLACDEAAPATLAPGEQLTCEATYTVTAADLVAGEVSNTASATGTPPKGEPVTGEGSAKVSVTAGSGGGTGGGTGGSSGGSLSGTGASPWMTAGALAALISVLAGAALFGWSRRRSA